MSNFSEWAIVFFAGLIGGLMLGISALDATLQSQCDDIGMAHLGSGYYNCQKRP